MILFSWPITNNKKDSVTFTLKDQLSSTPLDMFQSELTKTLEFQDQSANKNSTEESEDIDFDLPIIILSIPTKIFFLNLAPYFVIKTIKYISYNIIKQIKLNMNNNMS